MARLRAWWELLCRESELLGDVRHLVGARRALLLLHIVATAFALGVVFGAWLVLAAR